VKLEEILSISETEVSLKGLEHHYNLAVADYTLLRTQQRGLNPNAEPYKPKSPTILA